MNRKMAYLMVALALALALPACDEYYNYYPPSGTSWNGYKIFISTAHHGSYGQPPRDNTSPCLTGYSENTTSDFIAWQAADPTLASGSWHTLAKRGYRVRVGHRNLTRNAELSNAWGSDYHIIIHTNAATAICDRNADLNTGASGTETWYYPGSTQGEGLADELLDNIGPLSPGRRGGQEHTPRAAVSGSRTRPELAATSMPAAYVEAAFHTFGPDVDYLWSSAGWYNIGRTIAMSVDMFLGYPR